MASCENCTSCENCPFGIFSSMIFHGFPMFDDQIVLPSGKHTKSCWTWPFIVSFPIKNCGSFHSYGTVYQRVTTVSLYEGVLKWESIFNNQVTRPWWLGRIHHDFRTWDGSKPMKFHIWGNNHPLTSYSILGYHPGTRVLTNNHP